MMMMLEMPVELGACRRIYCWVRRISRFMDSVNKYDDGDER